MNTQAPHWDDESVIQCRSRQADVPISPEGADFLMGEHERTCHGAYLEMTACRCERSELVYCRTCKCILLVAVLDPACPHAVAILWPDEAPQGDS
jgi:hypothetical protein